MSDASTKSADRLDPGTTGKRRRRRRRGASIQSKLLLMLLATSVLSAAIVGYIGFRSGRQSLEAAAMDRLTLIRAAQTRQLEAQYVDLRDTLIVYTHGATTAEALRAFTAAFRELDKAPVEPGQDAALRHYYEDAVAGLQETVTGEPVDVRSLLPAAPAQKYLQVHYTINRTGRAAAIAVDDAGDGSAWTAAHTRFNRFFRTLVTRSEFKDALLLDPDGNVVYSAYKNIDLGTNVLAGPYRDSNLAAGYKAAMTARTVDYIGVTDFADYEPAGEPTAWLLAPIDAGSDRIGVLALEFPISKINRLMTVDGGWADAGLGKTGETFLVGPDNLMRSNSRLFLQDPEAYQRRAVRAGTPPDVIDKAIRQHGTTLVQPVESEATRLAAQGQTGDLIERNYLGHRALQSFAPVDLAGLRWTIVAQIDASEAFAPVAAFTRTLVLSTTGIVFVICLAAMVLARMFVRPIRQLIAGTAKIGSGDYDVDLPVLSHDELGDLTAAFNEMGRNLTLKEKLLAEQRKENDRLLLSVMPEVAVARYREGDEAIAIEHSDLTVIAAEIDHLDVLSAGLDSDESLSVVNTLIRQFDAAAESAGVETVQTLHDWYLAGCGLSVPRLDSVQRGLDFAIELERIIDRFNQETGNTLRLRIGVGTGPVTSGLIGRSNLAYDMWGSTVNLVYRLKNHTSRPGIYVTSRVREAVGDGYRFVAAGSITVDGTEEPVWRLEEQHP